MVEKILPKNLVQFCLTFDLKKELGADFFIKRVQSCIEANDLVNAGTLILDAKLFRKFDCLEICKNLGQGTGSS